MENRLQTSVEVHGIIIFDFTLITLIAKTLTSYVTFFVVVICAQDRDTLSTTRYHDPRAFTKYSGKFAHKSR